MQCHFFLRCADSNDVDVSEWYYWNIAYAFFVILKILADLAVHAWYDGAARQLRHGRYRYCLLIFYIWEISIQVKALCESTATFWKQNFKLVAYPSKAFRPMAAQLTFESSTHVGLRIYEAWYHSSNTGCSKAESGYVMVYQIQGRICIYLRLRICPLHTLRTSLRSRL